MSEPIWTCVQIRTPESWATDKGYPHEYLTEIENLRCYLGDWEATQEAGVDGTIWIFSGDANYGLSAETVEEALEWLLANRVPFIATSDTKYEYTGEIRVYNGNASREIHTGDYNEEVVLTRSKYKEFTSSAKSTSFAVAMYFERLDLDLKTVDISHLPTTPPNEDEDAA